MQVFVTIINVGMMISASVNAKNWLTKVYLMMNLFGILVIVNVNMVNHVILENMYIIKIVSAEKNGW